MTRYGDPHVLGDQLREEAARWFAVMRGPEAEASRADFETWLARDEAHRIAYNRIAETFSLGKRLKTNPADTPSDPAADTSRRRSKPSMVLALMGAAAVLTLAIQLLPTNGHENSPAVIARRHPTVRAEVTQLATGASEIRTFPLPDGSKVTLDMGSVVLVSYSDDARLLRLVRGRGRFTVAHENRPFAVLAGKGRITARGTLFDVALSGSGEVYVHLLYGTVDVNLQASSPGNVSVSPTRQMLPGQILTIGDMGMAASSSGPLSREHDWSVAVKDMDRVRLADLVAEANRHAATPIILGSAELGDQRLSGTFRLDDTGRLARNVADVLGLALTTSPEALLLSRDCSAETQKNCRPPS